MKPTRGNNSPACHSTLATTRRACWGLAALALIAAALGPLTAAAQGPDLQNGDIFVGAVEGSGSFGLTGPRIIWRVRDGVAERYAESSNNALDNSFFGIPEQMIVDSQGRIVFLAKLGAEVFNQDMGLFRVNAKGSPPERLAFRLGAGDILARYVTGQDDHALKLILRYAEVVAREGTVNECLDMNGIPRDGTGGQGNYLEHAGGFLWCVGKGLFGIDDFEDGSLRWSPRVPKSIREASGCYWHRGTRIAFGCTPDTYWLEPEGAQGALHFTDAKVEQSYRLEGKRVTIPRQNASAD